MRKFEKVAFLGQVPVFVKGKVKNGDFILCSGNNDGIGIAKSRNNIELSDFDKIVGISWENSDDPNIKAINLSIGVGKKELSTLAKIQNNKIENLENQILEIKKYLIRNDQQININDNNGMIAMEKKIYELELKKLKKHQIKSP